MQLGCAQSQIWLFPVAWRALAMREVTNDPVNYVIFRFRESRLAPQAVANARRDAWRDRAGATSDGQALAIDGLKQQ